MYTFLATRRKVFEAMGFNIDWNNETRVVRLERDDDVAVLTVDSDTFTVNVESFELGCTCSNNRWQNNAAPACRFGKCWV